MSGKNIAMNNIDASENGKIKAPYSSARRQFPERDAKPFSEKETGNLYSPVAKGYI
jgi:hypothetical protein